MPEAGKASCNRGFEQPADRTVDGDDFLQDVAPQPGDIIVHKEKPSAFFGTPLLSKLIERHIDTVIVTGCTTSGCVRGTVIEAFSNNFKVAVVENGVFDRAVVPTKCRCSTCSRSTPTSSPPTKPARISSVVAQPAE
jgi:nicotinamidase-related amidase